MASLASKCVPPGHACVGSWHAASAEASIPGGGDVAVAGRTQQLEVVRIEAKHGIGDAIRSTVRADVIDADAWRNQALALTPAAGRGGCAWKPCATLSDWFGVLQEPGTQPSPLGVIAAVGWGATPLIALTCVQRTAA